MRLVLVGDVDQLPSVGPGAVLSDLLGAGVVPSTHLTEVFRQAARSSIVMNAHQVNRVRRGEGRLVWRNPQSATADVRTCTPCREVYHATLLTCRCCPCRLGTRGTVAAGRRRTVTRWKRAPCAVHEVDAPVPSPARKCSWACLLRDQREGVLLSRRTSARQRQHRLTNRAVGLLVTLRWMM